MHVNKFLPIIITLLLLLSAFKASALTMEEFSSACHQFSGQCSDHPALNAYVGGALDLIATLSEQTSYLQKKIYCKEPKDVFIVSEIIKFMQANAENHIKENAMLVFLKYFESQGGCHEK